MKTQINCHKTIVPAATALPSTIKSRLPHWSKLAPWCFAAVLVAVFCSNSMGTKRGYGHTQSAHFAGGHSASSAGRIGNPFCAEFNQQYFLHLLEVNPVAAANYRHTGSATVDANGAVHLEYDDETNDVIERYEIRYRLSNGIERAKAAAGMNRTAQAQAEWNAVARLQDEVREGRVAAYEAMLNAR